VRGLLPVIGNAACNRFGVCFKPLHDPGDVDARAVEIFKGQVG